MGEICGCLESRKCDLSVPHSEAFTRHFWADSEGSRVPLRTFSQHPHWHPLTHLSCMYFQVLGSPRKPVKLLKVLNKRELARSHSTTELLPLNPLIITNQ